MIINGLAVPIQLYEDMIELHIKVEIIDSFQSNHQVIIL
jgi:hypothetical protein